MPKSIVKDVEKLYEDLCQELRHFPKNSYFYSSREIQKRYAATRQTVACSLQQLADEGQIILKERYRILVNDVIHKGLYNILFIHVEWDSIRIREYEAAIIDELKSRKKYEISMFNYDPINDKMNSLRQLYQVDYDAILFKIPVGVYSRKFIARMWANDKPTIFLDDHFFCAGANIIDTQPEYKGMLAAEHLLQNGHRKIALVCSEPWMAGLQRIYNGFTNRLKLAGIEVKVIDLNIKSGEVSKENARDKMVKLLQQESLDITAMFASSDFSALGLIDALKLFSKSIPDDISIICCKSCSIAKNCTPKLTTVDCDFKDIAKAVGDGLEQIFEGKGFEIKKIEPKVTKGESVKIIS